VCRRKPSSAAATGLERRPIQPAGPPFIRYLKTGERFEIELDGLRNACEQLVAWVEERDEEAAGPHWETYVTDPRTEPDTSKRITEIYLPLES
jgi:hypothetical protein